MFGDTNLVFNERMINVHFVQGRAKKNYVVNRKKKIKVKIGRETEKSRNDRL